MDNPPESPVPSPCNQVCRLDPEGVCEGCYRTIEEIAAWPDNSEAEKLTIIESARKRRQAAEE